MKLFIYFLFFLMSSFAAASNTTMTGATAVGNMVVKTPLVAKHTRISGNFTTFANQTVFDNSNIAGTITVNYTKETPVVELRCKSHVAGNISFLGTPGIVKKSNSSIISGKIMNGKIENIPQENCS